MNEKDKAKMINDRQWQLPLSLKMIQVIFVNILLFKKIPF